MVAGRGKVKQELETWIICVRNRQPKERNGYELKERKKQ